MKYGKFEWYQMELKNNINWFLLKKSRWKVIPQRVLSSVKSRSAAKDVLLANKKRIIMPNLGSDLRMEIRIVETKFWMKYWNIKKTTPQWTGDWMIGLESTTFCLTTFRALNLSSSTCIMFVATKKRDVQSNILITSAFQRGMRKWSASLSWTLLLVIVRSLGGLNVPHFGAII